MQSNLEKIAKKAKDEKNPRVSVWHASVSSETLPILITNASQFEYMIFFKIVYREERCRQVESETVKRSLEHMPTRGRRDRRCARPENSAALTVWLCGYASATTVSSSSLVRLSVDPKPRCGRPLRLRRQHRFIPHVSQRIVAFLSHTPSSRARNVSFEYSVICQPQIRVEIQAFV